MSVISNRQTMVFLDDVDASLRQTLAALVIPPEETPTATAPDWNSALVRLEGNLTGWQALLGEMAAKVQETQSELTLLDNDLKRSLVAFAAARKHLQGAAEV